MKGQRFRRRLGFALAGLRRVYRTEASFRTQLALGGGAATSLILVRPGAVWVALVALAIGLVLAAEALNASLECLADALHPAHHPLVGAAKDVAAAAVLVASAAAVIVELAMLATFLG